MSYLSFIIALVQLLNQGGTAGLTFYEGLDLYLDMVVNVERFFLNLSLIVGGVVFVIALVAVLLNRKSRTGTAASYGCGCYALILAVAWPILEAITYWIATGLANSVSAVGITDPTKFWLLVILMALLGAG